MFSNRDGLCGDKNRHKAMALSPPAPTSGFVSKHILSTFVPLSTYPLKSEAFPTPPLWLSFYFHFSEINIGRRLNYQVFRPVCSGIVI